MGSKIKRLKNCSKVEERRAENKLPATRVNVMHKIANKTTTNYSRNNKCWKCSREKRRQQLMVFSAERTHEEFFEKQKTCNKPFKRT